MRERASERAKANVNKRKQERGSTRDREGAQETEREHKRQRGSTRDREGEREHKRQRGRDSRVYPQSIRGPSNSTTDLRRRRRTSLNPLSVFCSGSIHLGFSPPFSHSHNLSFAQSFFTTVSFFPYYTFQLLMLPIFFPYTDGSTYSCSICTTNTPLPWQRVQLDL